MPRPEKSTSRIAFEAPGDYDTVEEALKNELPYFVNHSVDITIDESVDHIVVPPFIATWMPEDSDDELVPIQIKGGGSSVKSFTVLGGAGVIQAVNFNVTGSSPTEHGDAAVVSKDTKRLDLIDCSINTDGNAMVANGGQISSNGTEVDVPGWGVKTTNYGRYSGFGNVGSGQAGGDAYVAESGLILFNQSNNGRISGGVSASDKGIVINQGTNQMWGPNDVWTVKEIMRKTGRYSLPSKNG